MFAGSCVRLDTSKVVTEMPLRAVRYMPLVSEADHGEDHVGRVSA